MSFIVDKVRHVFGSSPSINVLSAECMHIAIRRVIDKHFFQVQAEGIPLDILYSLAYTVINITSAQEQAEQNKFLSVATEISILYKQMRGRPLSKEEQAYDKGLKEIDVMREVFNGIKWSSIFLLGEQLCSSVVSTVQHQLWSHLPAVMGYTAGALCGPPLIAKVVKQVLSRSTLSPQQQTRLEPWLTTVAKIALGFIPKVAADAHGVHYHYPSSQGSQETYLPGYRVSLNGDSLTLRTKGHLTVSGKLIAGKFNATSVEVYKINSDDCWPESVDPVSRQTLISNKGREIQIARWKDKWDRGETTVRSADPNEVAAWKDLLREKLMWPAVQGQGLSLVEAKVSTGFPCMPLGTLKNVIVAQARNLYSSSKDVANTYKAWGEALDYAQKAFELRIQVYGEANSETATSYRQIGDCFYQLRQDEKALDNFQRALDIDRLVIGNQSLAVSVDLENVAGVSFKLGLKEEAVALLEEASKIRQLFRLSIWD